MVVTNPEWGIHHDMVKSWDVRPMEGHPMSSRFLAKGFPDSRIPLGA